jgi:adenine deaminase
MAGQTLARGLPVMNNIVMLPSCSPATEIFENTIAGFAALRVRSWHGAPDSECPLFGRLRG